MLLLSNNWIHLDHTEKRSWVEVLQIVVEYEDTYPFQPLKENLSWRKDPKNVEVSEQEGKKRRKDVVELSHTDVEQHQRGKYSRQDQCTDLRKDYEKAWKFFQGM